MGEWRRTAKIVFVTAAVTSVAWLSVGAVMLQRYGGGTSLTVAPPLRVQAFADAARPGASQLERVAAGPPGRLVIPVAGVEPGELVDTFTQARASGARVHDAIDIMAPLGTPVVAAAPGRIEKLFISEDGGKSLYQRSPDGQLVYYYAHLDAYAPGLAEGQELRAGQRIGTVGFTGNANPAGPHLHFAVQRTTPSAKWYAPSTPLNPYPLLAGR